MHDQHSARGEPDVERLHAAFRRVRLQGADGCDHCNVPIPGDAPAVTFLATPPESTVATIAYTCSERCVQALLDEGWTRATGAQVDKLRSQLERHGSRVGEEDGDD